MSNGMKGRLPGTRLQGERHTRRRSTVPIKRTDIASQCVRAGNPEYPVTNTYADRKPDQDK